MEYLIAFALFFGGWIVVRFLLNASYASGFAEGAWHVANGGMSRIGQLARPVDESDLKAEFELQSQELGRLLNSRDFDQARTKAGNFGDYLVTRTWNLRSVLQ